MTWSTLEDAMTRSTLEDIDDLFEADEAADMHGHAFVRQSLSAVLVGRGVTEARARFVVLREKTLALRPDNRLREMAVRQVAADLLGVESGVRPTVAELDAGIAQLRGVQGMWPTLLEKAAALALRHGQVSWTEKALAGRLEIHDSECDIWLTLLLHASRSNGIDVQSLAELGFFAVTSAWDGTVDPVTSLLTLAALHGHESFGDKVHTAGAAWDRACQKVERSAPEWAVDADGVTLTVTIQGKDSLRDAAPWALEDLVYRSAQHVDDLMCERIPAAELAGPRTKKKATAIRAVTEHGVRAVAVLEGGAKLGEEDRAALEARQDAGLAWVRARHPSLSEMRGKLIVVG